MIPGPGDDGLPEDVRSVCLVAVGHELVGARVKDDGLGLLVPGGLGRGSTIRRRAAGDVGGVRVDLDAGDVGERVVEPGSRRPSASPVTSSRKRYCRRG